MPAPDAPLRVLLADDHETFRAALDAILTSDGIDVVAHAGTAEQAIAAAGAFHPDVVVLDIQMPGGGLQAAAGIHDRYPDIEILVLTASDTGDDLYAALQAGAHGYLLKTYASEQIAQAVTDLAQGQALIDPQLAGLLLTQFRAATVQPAETDPSSQHLTAREIEILRWMARGLSNRDIGRELFISENTVKNHVRSVLDKLHVHTRLSAVITAAQLDLIDLDAEVALSPMPEPRAAEAPQTWRM